MLINIKYWPLFINFLLWKLVKTKTKWPIKQTLNQIPRSVGNKFSRPRYFQQLSTSLPKKDVKKAAKNIFSRILQAAFLPNMDNLKSHEYGLLIRTNLRWVYVIWRHFLNSKSTQQIIISLNQRNYYLLSGCYSNTTPCPIKPFESHAPLFLQTYSKSVAWTVLFDNTIPRARQSQVVFQ